MSDTARMLDQDPQKPAKSGEDVYELRRTIEDLQQKLEDERNQNVLIRQENADLKAENERIQSTLQNFNQCKSRLAELEEANTSLNSQIVGFQASADELKRLRDEISELEVSSQEYNSLATQLRQEKASLEEELASKGAELSEAVSEMARLSSVIAELRAENNLAGDESGVESEDASILKRELRNSQKAIQILNDQFEIAREEGFQLGIELAEKQEELSVISAEAEEKADMLRATSRDLDHTKQAIETLNDNYYRLQEENFELSTALAENSWETEALESELEEKDANPQLLQVPVEETQILIKQVSASEQAVEVLNDSYYTLRDDHFELMEQYAASQDMVEELLAEREQQDSETEDVVRLKKQISTSEQAVDVINDNFFELQEKHFETMQELAEAQEMIEELLAERDEAIEDSKEPEEAEYKPTPVVIDAEPPEVMEEKSEEIAQEVQIELKNVGGLLGQMREKFSSLESRIAELEAENAELAKANAAHESNPFEGTQSVMLENEELKAKMEDLRTEYDRLSEQSIQDSMSLRTQQQDYESLNSSHQRLRQEKAGVDNYLRETQNRMEQYEQQVRMLMDANAELDETRHNLRQKEVENKKLKAELEADNPMKEEVRDLHRQLDAMRMELEEQESQRMIFAEQAASKDLALRQAQARVIELQSVDLEDMDTAESKEDESEMPGVNPQRSTADSAEIDEANGPEISDRREVRKQQSLTTLPFSLTQRASELQTALNADTQAAVQATEDFGAMDEYDMGDLDDEAPVERVDPHTIASDGKEIDPEDVEVASPSGGFRVHVEDSSDHKELDPTEVPIEIRSENTRDMAPRMSITQESARRISYVEEDETEPVRVPDVEETPDGFAVVAPEDIDI